MSLSMVHLEHDDKDMLQVQYREVPVGLLQKPLGERRPCDLLRTMLEVVQPRSVCEAPRGAQGKAARVVLGERGARTSVEKEVLQAPQARPSIHCNCEQGGPRVATRESVESPQLCLQSGRVGGQMWRAQKTSLRSLRRAARRRTPPERLRPRELVHASVVVPEASQRCSRAGNTRLMVLRGTRMGPRGPDWCAP